MQAWDGQQAHLANEEEQDARLTVLVMLLAPVLLLLLPLRAAAALGRTLAVRRGRHRRASGSSLRRR